MAWVAVAVGGAVGSVLRHAVNHMIAAHWIAARFPAGTTIVNLTGCLVIGLLAGLIAGDRLQLPLHSREFIFVGLLGGFTTFSSFGLEALTLARTGEMIHGAVVCRDSGGGRACARRHRLLAWGRTLTH